MQQVGATTREIAESINRRNFLLNSAALLASGQLTALGSNSAWADERFSGISRGDQAKIEKLVDEFRTTYKLAGVSIAMARRGTIRLAAGFGWADLDAPTAVTPQHQFRIASISKPITAAMVLLLVQRSQLRLSDTPFDDQALLTSFVYDLKLKPEQERRVKQITVQQLLEHTAGGWSNQNRDPMFAWEALHLNQRDLIRYIVKTFELKDDPGTTYRYSNFGYCVLGRVIEKVTRLDYEQAIRRNLLQPAGVETMTIGQRTLADRKPDEVRYYGQQEDPYHRIMNVARMDAHGGWIATPTQLVQLCLKLDGFDMPADLLDERTYKLMTTPSQQNKNYAKGWSVNSAKNAWHTGGFNGGSGILVRTNDQFCWAILVNSRSQDDGYFAALDRLGWDIRKAVTTW